MTAAVTPITSFTCRACGKHKSRHSASERVACSAITKELTLNYPSEKPKPAILLSDDYFNCLERKVR